MLLSFTASAVAAEHIELSDNSLEMDISYDKDATRLNEIHEDRSSDTKAFLMSDGTVEYEFYAGDVHYQLADGSWNLIDNSFVQTDKGER
jgi:hypothetical protein